MDESHKHNIEPKKPDMNEKYTVQFALHKALT